MLVFSGAVCCATNTARADCTPQAGAPICLSGTITAPDFNVALVEEPGKAGVTKLRQGDVIDEWSLDQIGPGFAVLGHDGQSIRLGLAGQPPEAPPPPTLAQPKRPKLRNFNPLMHRGEREAVKPDAEKSTN